MATTPLPGPIGVNSLTKADLAFVDAAIAMQRQEQQRRQVPPGAPAGHVEALFTCIFVLAYAAYQVGVWVYHHVTGRFKTSLTIAPGDDDNGLLPSATIDQLIALRNELAKVVGDTSVLK
jgi:hypothetical protein